MKALEKFLARALRAEAVLLLGGRVYLGSQDVAVKHEKPN